MIKRFLSELKRRKVIKPLVAYFGISWLLLQVVGLIVSFMNLHPLVGPASLLVVVCGFPVAAYLSWHFDFTMDGIERTHSIDDELNPKIEPFGPANWFGLSALVIISAFVGYHYLGSINEQQLASKEGLSTVKKADSIAVLPFTDQSPDKDQGYLAVGLAEEITGLLGSAEGFKVSASRSGQILIEQGLTPVDVGKRLNVQTILTGSVRATGSRLRVRLELMETETGLTLWTQSFMRELSDVFELEREISRAVVNLLQDRYVEAGDLRSLSETKSVDAYVMYLKGREQYRLQTTEGMKEARTLFEQAIALDPEYAKAYVALADTLASLSEGVDGFGVLKPEISARLAEQNLEKAMVREPNIAEIYAVMGVVNMLRDEYEDSLVSFKKALELNPSLAIAYTWRAVSLNELQRVDEAILALRKSRELDPLFLTNNYNLGMLLTFQGRYKEAEAIFNEQKKDFPESTFPYTGAATIYNEQGNYARAAEQWKKAVELSPENADFQYRLVNVVSSLGLTELMKELTSDPSFDSTILIFEGKFDALFEKMAFQLEADPDDYWATYEAGWYQAMFADRQLAAGLLIARQDSLSDADKYWMPQCAPAMEIAWAYQQLGQQTEANAIINQCELLLAQQQSGSISRPYLVYLEARIFALRGETDESLDSFARAVEIGLRDWWVKHDPLLASIQKTAEYERLITIIEDDLAQQREKVKALFYKGDSL